MLYNAMKRGATGEKRSSGAPIVLCPSTPSSSYSVNIASEGCQYSDRTVTVQCQYIDRNSESDVSAQYQ